MDFAQQRYGKNFRLFVDRNRQEILSLLSDSNQRPRDYKSRALAS